jgi:hypothetical protein
MDGIPILGPQPPNERQRLALLRGLTGKELPEDEGLVLPPGYERPKQNKRSGSSRKKRSKRR